MKNVLAITAALLMTATVSYAEQSTRHCDWNEGNIS